MMSTAPVKVAVVGPFSSGKSALINALVGEPLVPMGVTPLTAVLHRFRWSETRRIEVERHDGRVEEVDAAALVKLTGTGPSGASAREVRLYLPAGCLKDMEIWDTPGFGSNSLGHEVVARKALLEADVILWVTPIDHALDRGEAEKLARLRGVDTPVVLVLNKADLAESERERDEAVADITAEAGTLVHAVVWLSARLGLQAGPDPALREQSGLARLEPLLAELLVARMKARRGTLTVRPLAAGEVVCPGCHVVAQFDDRFCICGRPLADQHRACPRCTTDNAASRPRCRGCNLYFAAWERGEMLARQAEEEIVQGLLVDGLASLALALEEEPLAPGRDARRIHIVGVVDGLDALFRIAQRAKRPESAIAEWSRAAELYRTVACRSEVFQQRLADAVATWASAPRAAKGAWEAIRFAQGQGAWTPALARRLAVVRREVLLGEHRTREWRARKVGLLVASLTEDASNEQIEEATAQLGAAIAARESEQAAERQKALQSAERALVRRRLLEDEEASAAARTDPGTRGPSALPRPTNVLSPAAQAELELLHRVATFGAFSNEIVRLASLVVEGDTDEKSPRYLVAVRDARALPHEALQQQLNDLRDFRLITTLGSSTWRRLSSAAPRPQPASRGEHQPEAAPTPHVRVAPPPPPPDSEPLVSDDTRNIFGILGGIIGFVLGLGAGGIGAIPGAAIGAGLGYYLPEVGGCLLGAVLVLGIAAIILIQAMN